MGSGQAKLASSPSSPLHDVFLLKKRAHRPTYQPSVSITRESMHLSSPSLSFSIFSKRLNETVTSSSLFDKIV